MNISIHSFNWSTDKSIPDNHQTGKSWIASANNNGNMLNKGVFNQDTFINSNTSPAFTSVNPAMAYLRKYANDFRCAYSGLRMISISAYKHILSLASKNRKSDKWVINHVSRYQEAMDGVELDVFRFYKHRINQNINTTIKSVTDEQFHQSFNKLRIKYLRVINTLREQSPAIKAEKTRLRYNAVLDGWEQDLIKGDYNTAINSRKYIQILQKIKYGDKNNRTLDSVNKSLKLLPSPSEDFDAFIVKNKDSSRKQFINNLISPFLVSIEHVKSKNKGGHASSISNCILVRSKDNWEKSNTPLETMLLKYPDRAKHIQEYFRNVVNKVNNGGMKEYSWYPFEIKKTLENESKHKLHLDSSKLLISEEEAYKSFTA